MVAALCGLVLQGGMGREGRLGSDRRPDGGLMGRRLIDDDGRHDEVVVERSDSRHGSDMVMVQEGVSAEGREDVSLSDQVGLSTEGYVDVTQVDQEGVSMGHAASQGGLPLVEGGVSLVDHLITSLPETETTIAPTPVATEIVRLALTGDLTGDWTGVFDWELLGGAEAVASTMDAPYIYYTPDPDSTTTTTIATVTTTTATTSTIATTTASTIVTPSVISSLVNSPLVQDVQQSPSSLIDWLRGLDWGWHHWHHEEEGMGEYL